MNRRGDFYFRRRFFKTIMISFPRLLLPMDVLLVFLFIVQCPWDEDVDTFFALVVVPGGGITMTSLSISQCLSLLLLLLLWLLLCMVGGKIAGGEE